MKKVAIFILSLSVVSGAFSYWGFYTESGKSRFDEMAGMIPWFAQVFSIVLLLIAVIMFLILLFNPQK